MNNLLAEKARSPYVVGSLIGMLSWFSFASADQSIGVTTAFENSAALLEKAAVPNIERINNYFAAKKAEGKSPKIDWEWMLVLGIFVGAIISSRLSGDRTTAGVPDLWAWRFGNNKGTRLIVAFLSGGLMMFGARLAQGCTSGHGISGALQFAVSSWLFIVVAFGVGIVTTFTIYGREGAKRV